MKETYFEFLLACEFNQSNSWLNLRKWVPLKKNSFRSTNCQVSFTTAIVKLIKPFLTVNQCFIILVVFYYIGTLCLIARKKQNMVGLYGTCKGSYNFTN